jgi:cellulose synthase/poly-beta-1,6-N-acetylglucosamine synthase-like glycosyltransferase
LSSGRVSSRRRIVFTIIFLSLVLFSLIAFTRQSLLFLAYFITVFYIAWGVYHILLTIKGVGPVFRPRTPPSRFPKVSVIVPAMNEPILPRTIEVLVNHQAYPAGLKEVIVVTDDPLGERLSLFMQQKYPENVRALARRAFYPTKPSALNDGLRLCSGEIVGIVDVEDIPDSDVFQKAVSALVDYGYDAVQAILRINNEEDSWITRVFAYEYAGWFRIWLNGRSRLGLYTPLGGTGNYFWKTAAVQVGGWDSLNVAEDAELAVRMTLAKMKIGVIDARHWEEAPVTFKKWLRQRTRWFRGWLQSLWKYAPLLWRPSFVKRIGFIKLLSILLMLLTPIVVLLNWVSFALTGLWILELYGITPPLLSNVFPVWAILPAFFNVIYISAWLIGGRLERVKTPWWSVILPMLFYTYVMMPIASLRAIYQEITKPVIWEKTEHPGRGVVGFVAETEAKQQIPAAYQPYESQELQLNEYYTTPQKTISEGAAIAFWSFILALDLLFIWLLLSNPSILS